MNTLDWILVGIAAVFALRCLFRGFVKEILSAAALVAGGLAGVAFYQPIGELFGKLTGLKTFLEVIGFVIAFLVAFVVVKLIERALRTTLEALKLGGLDKLLGFLLGAVEGLVIVSLVLILLSRQSLIDLKALLDGSVVARTLLPVLVKNGALPG